MKKVSLKEITIAIKKIKLRKTSGLSEVSMKMTNASGKVGIDVMMKLCWQYFFGKGMPVDWGTIMMVPICKGKEDVMNCGAYRGVKLLEHEMKIVERVLEKRIRALVAVDDMQFGFMPGRGTTGAFFIVRRMQEEYRKKDKMLHIDFVDLEKAFDRVMQWVLRKKGLSEILVKEVMSLYEG